jgi:Zn-dependent M28 family amino/carboxypeptidase
MRRCAAVVGLIAVLTSCANSAPDPAASPTLPTDLANKIKTDSLFTHLHKLQEIADANKNSRAGGTPGYDASVDYVTKFLQDKGFDVQTPEVEVLDRSQGGNPTVTVAGRTYHVDQASLLLTTAPGGLSARTLRPEKHAGCSTADYGKVSVKGAIAVVDDTGCSIVDKQNTAVAQGAVGLLVASTVGSNPSPPGLFPPGYYEKLTIPVGVVDSNTDAAIRHTDAPVRLVLDSQPVLKKVRNVLAQTRTGATNNVVIIGAHLDSAPKSPGINDDGTGVAALLETAAALGSEPKAANAVRFAFWGSEEYAEQGAGRYLRGLPPEQLDDIALYLNVDMIGSPNAGYFTYDGDQTAQPNPEIPLKSVPDGSAGIERTLAGYLNSAGVRPADIPLAKNTDYYAFLTAGVPIGGVTTGASQPKTDVQARLWGGRAGVAFDPDWRTPRDSVDTIDAHALTVMAAAAAFAVGTYTQSTDGVNGVPPRGQRHRNNP